MFKLYVMLAVFVCEHFMLMNTFVLLLHKYYCGACGPGRCIEHLCGPSCGDRAPWSIHFVEQNSEGCAAMGEEQAQRLPRWFSTSFLELIDMTQDVEASWASYRTLNSITVDSCPKKGPHRYEAQHMKYISTKHKDYKCYDHYRSLQIVQEEHGHVRRHVYPMEGVETY